MLSVTVTGRTKKAATWLRNGSIPKNADNPAKAKNNPVIRYAKTT
jgi:hypothetical protein